MLSGMVCLSSQNIASVYIAYCYTWVYYSTLRYQCFHCPLKLVLMFCWGCSLISFSCLLSVLCWIFSLECRSLQMFCCCHWEAEVRKWTANESEYGVRVTVSSCISVSCSFAIIFIFYNQWSAVQISYCQRYILVCGIKYRYRCWVVELFFYIKHNLKGNYPWKCTAWHWIHYVFIWEIQCGQHSSTIVQLISYNSHLLY